ncbi:MAG TPA: TIM barrel protein [Spirochaetia bacterium]|nr:TIM barrel protein [Spirochaetia bacterium]
MAKLGVCIELFFTGEDYSERLKRVSALGYKYFEFWFHNKRFDGQRLVDEEKDLDRLWSTASDLGMSCTDFVFNHPDGGIVGSLIDGRDHAKVLDGLEGMIERAKKLGCKQLISGAGNRVPGLPTEKAIDNMIEVLSKAARICEKSDTTLILEPFNTKVDHPDYFLDDPQTCVNVLKTVNHPNVKMLFDLYHMQIMSGNLLAFIKENLSFMGHFHIAGVPGRHEPQQGELNYPYILEELDRLGYDGGVGLEYWPAKEDSKSLKETKMWLEGTSR